MKLVVEDDMLVRIEVGDTCPLLLDDTDDDIDKEALFLIDEDPDMDIDISPVYI